ncbi:hypothetical protein Tco_0409968 [Tanacetum coccineum]
MADESNVSELVDKKGGANKPEWINDERMVFSKDQCLKSIVMSCLLDDIIESVISCEIAKATWTDLDEEKVSDDEEMTQVKVLTALADNELAVGKNHARNGEWIDITMRKITILLSMDKTDDWQTYLKYINIDLKDYLLIFKQDKLDAVTFQIQNTELIKLNHALQEQLKKERKVNEKWLNSSNKVSQCISEQIPNQKKKILGIEQLTESSSKNNVKENPIIPASLAYGHEMIPKSKDWVKRHNRDSKLPNFNTERILVLESQAVNECLITKAPTDPDSSKDSGSEPLTPLHPLKNLQGASPSSEVMSLTYQDHFPRERAGLCIIKHIKHETQESSSKSVSGPVTICVTKPITFSVLLKINNNEQDSKLNELTKLVQMLINEKVNSS